MVPSSNPNAERGFTAAALQGLLALMLILGLAACGGRGASLKTPPGPPPLGNGYAVWTSLEDADGFLVAPTKAEVWLGVLRERGVATVYLTTRTTAGEVAWPSRVAPLFKGRGDQLHTAIEAGRRVGVEIVAVFPAFLAPPQPGEELVTYGWSQGEQMARLRPWPGEATPRISPATRSARTRQLALLAELAGEDIDALCLSHVGYPGLDADFSDGAREAFSRDTGLSVAEWPDSIVRFDPPPSPDAAAVAVEGIHNTAWQLWRSATVADFLGQAAALSRLAHQRAGRGDLRLALMTPGYYPLHLREGVNWAERDRAANWVLTDLPTGSEQYTVGQYFDEIVLETLVPVGSAEGAATEGLAWWSSVEGALRVARPLVGDEKRLRVALALYPYASLAEDADGVGSGEVLSAFEQRALVEALRAARMAGTTPLVLDATAIDEYRAWPLINLAARPSTR